MNTEVQRLPADRPQADWLIGGGEMAGFIKAKDWSVTPLGPIDSWPQSLRTVVSLTQASSSPISLAWGPHHIQIYNDGYWPICGDKHPSSMGQDFRECWAAAWPVIREAYESAWAGKSAYLENMRMFLDRYGFLEETWFTFSFSPITDESGRIAGLFHPVTELTAQSLSERRTQTLRELAAQAGKSKTAPDAFEAVAAVLAGSNLDLPFFMLYMADDSGHGARLAAHAGLAPGSPLSPLQLDLDAPGAALACVPQVLRSGQPQRIDDLAHWFAGAPVGPYPEQPKSATALPIVLPGRGPVGVLVAGTSSRLHWTAPYSYFLELLAASVSAALANAHAHEHEKRRAEALAELDRDKTAFFSNVSHEFRTPLTLMLAPLEDELNERDAPLPQERRARIVAAHGNSLRLLKMVNNLLDFSRIEAGRAQASFAPTDLAALTAELASSFRSAVERAGLTLTVDCPPLPEPVFVDHDMWEKIVLNLLSNALKHTFTGGIRVRLAWVDGGAELTLRDSGVGIPTDEIPRLFDRFHRVKGAASRTHEGSGIGLTLARELVQLHGGVIGVHSEVAVGTCFTVRLKAGTSHLPVEQLGSAAASIDVGRNAAAHVQEAMHWLAPPPAASARAPGPRPRILWADDNTDMRDYVARLLSRDYHVTAVCDGRAALDAALAAPPDLVLSDIMMPRLDGIGLLKALRADDSTRRLPVILLSARAGEESALDGLAAGADDYLVKPFSAKELLARVRANLSLAGMRKEWEAKLIESNRRLADAAQAKDRFLATMSHEIRTPLNAVIGMAELLSVSPLNERQTYLANTIRVSGDHLLTVINDILDYSKMASDKLVIEHIEFRVAQVLAEAVAMVDSRAREKNLELVCEVLPQVPEFILGDPGRVRQVLLNFLSNSLKFTERGGIKITVGSSPRPDGRHEIIFSVRDTGIGLTEEQCSGLFQMFSQADTSSARKYGGTGLGLAISRRLAELMGGAAEVESEFGRGSTFRFSIVAGVSPRSAAAQPILAVAAPPCPADTAATLAQRLPLRILLAEDNPINVALMTLVLEGLGYGVDVSVNGLEAIAALRRQPYDVILMDIRMPDMDGIEATRRICREWPGDRRPCIIALTAGVMPEERQACIDAGVDDFLAKPIVTAQLVGALEHCGLLRSARAR